MSDRELLEFAAKAAGINVVRSRLDDPMSGDFLVNASARNPHQVSGPWNPITDDGDAMRLMVRLRLHARQFPVLDNGFDAPLGMVEVWRVDDDDPMHVEFLKAGDDRLVFTRRAIVRAAAKIGRQMP